MTSTTTSVQKRLDECARAWRVSVERTSETATSVLAFGTRDGEFVVLKTIKAGGDEWLSGAILQAFRGRGAVPVLEQMPGAILMARVRPATLLAQITLAGGDEAATGILAQVIRTLSPADAPSGTPTLRDWARGFERYLEGGDRQVPRDLVREAQRAFLSLCDSQSHPRLLHGDLHHYNVALDDRRGWLAFDPKGVLGEIEDETGAAFRNPYEQPDLFTMPFTIEARAHAFASVLDLDIRRIRRWAFAQAVLSTIWLVEDGFAVSGDHPCLTLARALRRMDLAGD